MVRRWWECLIDQVDGEGVVSFVGKLGKPVFSCSGGPLGYSGVWELGTLVV